MIVKQNRSLIDGGKTKGWKTNLEKFNWNQVKEWTSSKPHCYYRTQVARISTSGKYFALNFHFPARQYLGWSFSNSAQVIWMDLLWLTGRREGIPPNISGFRASQRLFFQAIKKFKVYTTSSFFAPLVQLFLHKVHFIGSHTNIKISRQFCRNNINLNTSLNPVAETFSVQ